MKDRDRWLNSHNSIIVLSLIVFLFLVAGSSYSFAYLTWTNDESLVNSFSSGFTKPDGTIAIQEELINKEKRNVGITNEGNIDVYVRVALRPSWLVCKDGGEEDCKTSAITPDSVSITVPDSWLKIKNYYYYKSPVSKNETTEFLIGESGIKEPDLKPEKEGHVYKYQLDVVAASIQAQPTDAIKEAWKVKVKNGKITK